MSSNVDPTEHPADTWAGVSKRFGITHAKPASATTVVVSTETQHPAHHATFGTWAGRNDSITETEAMRKEWTR